MSDSITETQTTDGNYASSLWYNRDFVRLLVGRLVTNAGDSLYFIAAVWLVFELTGSSFYTGIAVFLTQIPRALQFLVGPLVDRWPLRGVLVGTQLVQGIAVLSIPIAAYAGTLTVWLVLVVVPALAMLNQFVYPAQNAALPLIVSEDKLTRANSAFRFGKEGTSMLFQGLAGILIGFIGATSLYVVDSVTFAVAVLLFVGVRIPPANDSTEELDESIISSYLGDLSDGIDCLRGSVFVEVIATSVLVSFMIGVSIATLPAFGALRGGSDVYGLFMGALGAGLALGAAATSLLESVKYGHVRMFGYGLSFALWLGAVYAPWVIPSIGLFALAWVPVGVNNVMWGTMVQTVVPDDFIGRVTSVSASASMAALPVGSLLGGTISATLGSVTTMALAGAGFGFVSLYFAARPRLRRLPAMDELDPEEFDISPQSYGQMGNDG